ncbi:MAG: hypothetical protein LBR10_10325 [Prevotellaceae bacterium]|nr:hypothetical protein [Prevotellaceae bacterium]
MAIEVETGTELYHRLTEYFEFLMKATFNLRNCVCRRAKPDAGNLKNNIR